VVAGLSGISTHILDTARGLPAAGIAVTLEQLIGEGWSPLATHPTDADGRIKQFLSAESPLAVSHYRLTFDTQSYFDAQHIEGLYPLVQITFSVRDKGGHYHIPLLLTANGYTTYRGS
jgi:5-hydroxyisourate hydrolase